MFSTRPLVRICVSSICSMVFQFCGPAWSQAALGCSDFQYRRRDGIFWVYSNRCNGLGVHGTRVHHGCCLSQCFAIMQEGFKVGLYQGPATATSPNGIWCCDTFADALDRCTPIRGYDARNGLPLGAWSVPVTISWKSNNFATHCTLHNGCRVMVERYRYQDRVPMLQRPLEVWVHQGLWNRFEMFPDYWGPLRYGRMVACCATTGNPKELFETGHGRPLTCGRVLDRDEAERMNRAHCGWTKTNRNRWQCPFCVQMSPGACMS